MARFCQPRLAQLYSRLDLDLRRLAANDRNEPKAAILDEAGIPHLDTLPQFQTWAAQPEAHPLYFRYDFHWSPAGHALAAQVVESFLRESELMESSNGN